MTEYNLDYLPPDASQALRDDLREASATVAALRRRGHDLGFLVRHGRPSQPEELRPRWDADLPIHLPGVLAGGLEVFAEEIDASTKMFDRLRRGERFLEELEQRLSDQESLVPSGSTVDRGDEREIEKVWMQAIADGETVADELWAKLSWIAHDDADRSLRVAFSFGIEQIGEWREDTSRAPFADAACEEAFPECRTITGHVPLVEALRELLGAPQRFSERILYSNAPGGGAMFHHDVEPSQRGVIFGQLAGRTAWLALPKRALAEHLRAAAEGALSRRATTPAAALAVLDDESDVDRSELLNTNAEFTKRLVESGAAFLLEPGDALLLPNHGPDDTCWHSVFAVGRASLGHSYGMFDATAESSAGSPGDS
jgi:hypothetical protein